MRFLLTLCATLTAAPALAEGPVNITPQIHSITVPTQSGPVTISRIQDTTHQVTGEWARSSRECPNFCIQPMSPAPGVTTVGELDVLNALQDPAVTVIDSRVPTDHASGTIPGALSMPYTEMADRLHELGCEPDFEGFDCGTEARQILLFCNGAWCGQSPTAIRRIIKAGYPPEKISYYRGGMQAWRLLGLTVTAPE